MSDRAFFRSIGAKRPLTRLATVVSLTFLLAATLGADAPQGLKPGIRATAQQLTFSSSQRERFSSWADRAAGKTSDAGYTPPATDFQAVPETSIDIAPAGVTDGAHLPNAACSPVVTKATGKFSSGGSIVIAGNCLGTAGNVAITGFPNGNPQVKIVSWTPTAINAQFPIITGVPDLTMHVQVTAGTFSLKPFDAKFVASWGDPILLPNKYIVISKCESYMYCGSAPHSPEGVGADYQPTFLTDVWMLNLPEHFHVHAVHFVQLMPAGTEKASIGAGSGNAKTLTVTSAEGTVNGFTPSTTGGKIVETCSVDVTDIVLGIFTAALGDWTSIVNFVEAAANSGCSTTTYPGTPILIPTYYTGYRVDVYVRGPAGMTP